MARSHIRYAHFILCDIMGLPYINRTIFNQGDGMKKKDKDQHSILEAQFDLSDDALEMAAGNQLEIGACITSTDRTSCGCRTIN